jgi:hypothetical protein
MRMIDFEVSDPLELPVMRDNRIRHLSLKSLNDFWQECDPEYGGMRNGCYVFGMRTKNIKPWYVGKTWKGFRKETFNPYQQTKIARYINNHGCPVVILVYKKYKRHESAHTKEVIRSLETFLIQTAVAMNPDLLNVHGTEADWSIAGVMRSIQVGKPSGAIKHFKRMLDL